MGGATTVNGIAYSLITSQSQTPDIRNGTLGFPGFMKIDSRITKKLDLINGLRCPGTTQAWRPVCGENHNWHAGGACFKNSRHVVGNSGSGCTNKYGGLSGSFTCTQSKKTCRPFIEQDGGF